MYVAGQNEISVTMILKGLNYDISSYFDICTKLPCID